MGVHSDPRAEASLQNIEQRIAQSVDRSFASISARAQQSDHYKRLWQASEAENARLAVALANTLKQVTQQRDEIEALTRAVEGRRILA